MGEGRGEPTQGQQKTLLGATTMFESTTTYVSNLTRRDELAEKILLAILEVNEFDSFSDDMLRSLPVRCYRMADAMIVESKKGTNDGEN